MASKNIPKPSATIRKHLSDLAKCLDSREADKLYLKLVDLCFKQGSRLVYKDLASPYEARVWELGLHAHIRQVRDENIEYRKAWRAAELERLSGHPGKTLVY